MAVVVLDPRVPNNISRVSSHNPRAVQEAYERGDLVILTDVKIAADFEFLSTVRSPIMSQPHREKFCLYRQEADGPTESRSAVWEKFESDSFAGQTDRYQRFRRETAAVNAQLNALMERLFPSHRFLTRAITWKLQRISGENLHIDNLQGCQFVSQVRLFSNLHSTPRVWGTARHWRHYARRFFDEASLGEVIDDAYGLNLRLTIAAFGYSNQETDEPRHVVSFEPGEVWLLNSAVVAHQVRSGSLLTIAHYEYPYSDYRSKRESLPSLIKEIGREKYGRVGFLCRRMRLALAVRPQREG